MMKKANQHNTDFETPSQASQHVHAISTHALKVLTKNLDDVLIISDLAGSVVFISDTFESLVGYNKERYFGTSWKQTISEETAQYITSDPQQFINKEFKINFAHANGQKMLLKCIIDLVRFDDEGERFYVITIQDITSKKDIEELMIRTEKMSVAGQLAAGIVHEIRNPLTALKGFIQLLQSNVGDKEAYYRVMIDEIEKMNEITSELLLLSKPMTDYFDSHVLHGMVSDIIMLFQPQAKEKDISIINKVEEELLVYCDQTQIKQILINLIKNALEAMTKPGNILVSSRILADFIQIDVIDEGAGIDGEAIDKINEPFYTTKPEGTGLGLVITKQIIEQHHGVLEVFRNAEVGTTFRILLPKID